MCFGRNFMVDILCETKTGWRFLIQIRNYQNDGREDYTARAFMELCRLISHWDAEVIHQEKN